MGDVGKSTQRDRSYQKGLKSDKSYQKGLKRDESYQKGSRSFRNNSDQLLSQVRCLQVGAHYFPEVSRQFSNPALTQSIPVGGLCNQFQWVVFKSCINTINYSGW